MKTDSSTHLDNGPGKGEEMEHAADRGHNVAVGQEDSLRDACKKIEILE